MADGLDVSRLSPADAVVALRSYARRFRAALALHDDERPDDVVHRPDSGGVSALGHAARAARAIDGLADAVERALVRDRPALSGWLLDPPAVDESTVDGALDEVGRAAERFAVAAERVEPAEAWARTAVVGDRELTAVDLLREAVRLGASELRAAERAVAEARAAR